MPFTAGQKLRASQLAMVQPVKYTALQTGNGGGQQTIGTTETDCLGCTVTFTTLTAAVCEIVAWWDVDVTTGGSAVAQGRVNVDTATLSQEAHFSIITSGSRTTMGRSWKFTLSGAGSHTVKTRILKTAAVGTALCDDLHTSFTLTVQEVL